jgi:hypothetical protein
MVIFFETLNMNFPEVARCREARGGSHLPLSPLRDFLWRCGL